MHMKSLLLLQALVACTALAAPLDVMQRADADAAYSNVVGGRSEQDADGIYTNSKRADADAAYSNYVGGRSEQDADGIYSNSKRRQDADDSYTNSKRADADTAYSNFGVE